MPPKTIKLTRDPHVGLIREGEQAGAAITPGEVLEFAADGDLQAHSTAGGHAFGMVALEEEFQETASGTSIIDVDYSSGDNVRYIEPFRGCELYAWLADGHTVSKGDPLESDGSGALQPQGTGAAPNAVVAYAAEDKDTSGGDAVRERIRVKAA